MGKAPGKLTDLDIRSWMQRGERFEGRSFGNGLTLRFRASDKVPAWRFRYSISGRARTMNLAGYDAMSLAEARKKVRELRARVALGHDVAKEKRERKAAAAASIDARRNALTVAELCDRYLAERVIGRLKHPNIVRNRLERDVKPTIGSLRLDDVRPHHIDKVLKDIVKRGAPTTSNNVLRWLKRIFDYAAKRELMRQSNPAAPFDTADAGGTEKPRSRWLTQEELAQLFTAMRMAKGWAYENTLTVKLLLMLACRKSELIAAPIAEFDMTAGVWHLPAQRVKTGHAIDIPLPSQAMACLAQLIRLAGRSAYLLPARKLQTRMTPHIAESTLGAAIGKSVRPLLPDVERFTVHDLRRTARTHLEALGTPPHVAEACLNHKPRGIIGVYNQHSYFEERKEALQAWADHLQELEERNAILLSAKPARRVV